MYTFLISLALVLILILSFPAMQPTVEPPPCAHSRNRSIPAVSSLGVPRDCPSPWLRPSRRTFPDRDPEDGSGMWCRLANEPLDERSDFRVVTVPIRIIGMDLLPGGSPRGVNAADFVSFVLITALLALKQEDSWVAKGTFVTSCMCFRILRFSRASAITKAVKGEDFDSGRVLAARLRVGRDALSRKPVHVLASCEVWYAPKGAISDSSSSSS